MNVSYISHQQYLSKAKQVVGIKGGLFVLVEEERHPKDNHDNKEVLEEGVTLAGHQHPKDHHRDGLGRLPQNLATHKCIFETMVYCFIWLWSIALFDHGLPSSW